MPVVVPISDPADPRVREFANLTDAELRAADWAGSLGVFVAEGELVVRRMIGSRFKPRSLLVTQAGFDRLGEAAGRLDRQTPIYLAAQSVLESIVGFPFHRGILACGERIPEPPVDDVLAGARVLVILENLSNHDNVGGVFRDVGALAGAGAAVLLSPGCCDPLYRKSLRVSMGQALRVPFARLPDWPRDLARVKGMGFRVLALTPDPAARGIRSIPPGEYAKPALMLGAEGPGLSPPAFELADERIRIPMAPGADSLNVAVAAAVALSQLCDPR